MKTRYFHLRIASDNWVSMSGGGTAKVVQENIGDDHVYIQTTRCSFYDTFVKKIGREEAEKAEKRKILLVDLPKELAELHRKACKECGVVRWALRPSDFAFSVLYFLRK